MARESEDGEMGKCRYIELLAPARDVSVGRVAIDSGADAVYIGGPAFGARKAAGNSIENIRELCEYAHLFGVRVFVTLNTLLHDDEMDEAVRLAHAYNEIGVDAILIQDLRLAARLFATGEFEGKLHASTQCDIRNVEKVKELEAMGFAQVVLARELSYSEIRSIHEQTAVPLEAFVHGALCVSYSGACYLSEAVCGRSANRGECAQMCRLPYDVLDENGNEILHGKHVLSLLDLDRSAHLQELIDSGVTTLKIEGRLKDADYVRNVVAYYRQKLDALFAASNGHYAQSSYGETRIAFTPDPAKTFHRGATEYFSFERPAHLVNMDTPKSTGELLGYAPIKAEWGLQNGDGLVAFGTAAAQTDAYANASASLKRHRSPLSPYETSSMGTPKNNYSEGFYWPSRVRIPVGLPIYRTYNAEFQRQLAAKDATKRVLKVKIVLRETEEGFEVEMTGPINNAFQRQFHTPPSLRATSPTLGEELHKIAFPAEKVPATNGERAEAMVRQQLSKLGDTPFEAEEVRVEWSQPYFLQAATLNAWRREAVQALLESLEGFRKVKKGLERFSLDGLGRSAEPCRRVLPRQTRSIGEAVQKGEEGLREVKKGEDAIEPSSQYNMPEALMTCKYCLLYEMGCCKKRNPRKTGVPTYLRRGDLLLRIETDCKECVMKLKKA
ncbi:MAG: U32 family peptidase [Paludibacteraceae bacterium]|nr:U32 family peptidase [Paludibacteraceae bacterium]